MGCCLVLAIQRCARFTSFGLGLIRVLQVDLVLRQTKEFGGSPAVLAGYTNFMLFCSNSSTVLF